MDALDTLDCLSKSIGDVDLFHVQNCRTVRIHKNDTTFWTVTIFATKSFDTGDETRFSYGTKFAPGRRSNFWKHVGSSETKRRLRCVQSQLIIKLKRKGFKKKPEVEKPTQSPNCKAQTEAEVKKITMEIKSSATWNKQNYHPTESVVNISFEIIKTRPFFPLKV